MVLVVLLLTVRAVLVHAVRNADPGFAIVKLVETARIHANTIPQLRIAFYLLVALVVNKYLIFRALGCNAQARTQLYAIAFCHDHFFSLWSDYEDGILIV